jgi:phospholipid/cholesterol/gamma-HCH transport system substrate-binding protein
MGKEIFVKIRLGLFVTIGTLLLISAMYFIGDKQNLFGSTFEIRAVFNNVNGLQKGNNVRYSGIDVGTVKSVTILNDTTIEVTMVIEEKVKRCVKQDAMATLGTDGLMGNKLINISPGSPMAEIINELDVLHSINELDADEMLRRLEETNNNIAIMSSSLVTIIKKVNDGEGSIGKLLNDTTLAHDVSKTLANLRALSSKTVKISSVIEENISKINLEKGTIGTLLTDTLFATNLSQTIADIQKVSSNTEQITQELKTMITNVKEGEGTAGLLLKDSTLSNNLEKSLDNLQQGSKAFNENMEALKHNFLLRRYFRKKVKEEKKVQN